MIYIRILLVMMLLAVPRLLGFGEGPFGDATIVFGLASLFGLLGWLNVAALTIARWAHIPTHIKLIQNSPAALSAITYALVALTQAK